MLVIDRFEGGWAVIEQGDKTFNIPVALLPEGAAEGDLISIKITLDPEAAGRRREAVRRLADRLFED